MVQAEAKELVEDNPTLTKVGRVGWFAKGLVYLVAGVLAVLVTLRSLGWNEADDGDEASPTGALKEVSQHGFGGVMLILFAAGLLIYAGWRLVSAVLPGRKELKVYATRVGYLVSAIMYATFAYTAIKLIGEHPSKTDGNSEVTSTTGEIMSHTGGRLLIGAVGVVLLGVAAYRINLGRTVDVTDELDMSSMTGERRLWIKRLGAVGEVGRGLALALIGFFLIRAALTYDADEATGLDGALRRAAEDSRSRILVAIVALGFISYGLFCLATFNHRRFEAPT